MKRGAPMRRTPFNRAAPAPASTKPAAEPKPRKPKKPKLSKCAVKTCRTEFVKPQPFVNWCSAECGAVLGMEKLSKQRAAKEKAERIEARRKAEDGMSLQDRLKATEKLVNRYVVLRDRFDGCISCYMPSHYDGAWHASHFKSVGSNSAMRFNLWNIHKGCAQCNLFKSGNIAEYEKRLVLKIGQERVDWIKCQNRSRVYTHEYLIRLSAIMRRKIKRLEKRHASR